MTVLVIGPNGSGKSAYAEQIAAGLSEGRLYYVATMLPYGDEGRARVQRHREQRSGRGFVTIERPAMVSELSLPDGSVALLEDVSNLLSNMLFGSSAGASCVFGDIRALCDSCRHAVLVSIDGLVASRDYDDGTVGYIGALNRLNTRLADFADIVIAMRDGAPVFVKGGANALG